MSLTILRRIVNRILAKLPVSFITVYEVTRHYGGPEEGGWWYNWNEPIRTRLSWFTTKEKMAATFANRKYGDIYSVLGGVDIRAYKESYPGEFATTIAPYYE